MELMKHYETGPNLLRPCFSGIGGYKAHRWSGIMLKEPKKDLLYSLFAQKVGNQVKSMGFKVQKFHGFVHVPGDILVLGVPLESNTGHNESGHKGTKTAAKLTQQNEVTFCPMHLVRDN